jgi:hypothetical protein
MQGLLKNKSKEHWILPVFLVIEEGLVEGGTI